MARSSIHWPGLYGQSLTIYVISPQPWEGLKVSKHHYATELAALGHHVYFIEPPSNESRRKAISICPTDVERVSKVTYVPWFPYVLKFHASALFDLGMRRQSNLIVSAIGIEPNIVWDFDNARRFADLRWFGAQAFRILHPVDNIAEGSKDRSADVILAVAKRFIERIRKTKCPNFIVPHGLGRLHEEVALRTIASPEKESSSTNGRIVVGYVGNLEHVALDWMTITRLITENDTVHFIFIGPYREETTAVPLTFLRSRKNVELLGLMPPEEMVAYSGLVDLWLVCYDPSKSIDAATNSHKVLEYFASGNLVVSNSIAAYRGSDLIEMPEGDGNEELSFVFQSAIARLDQLNAASLRRRRADYALQHTYRANVELIDEALSSQFGANPGRATTEKSVPTQQSVI